MKNIDINIDSLRNAIDLLEKAYEVYKSGDEEEEMCKIYADSCVKRYEYTFETAWKIMKKYFKLQYHKTEEELTMNNIFRLMEGYGFTKSWLNWKSYYEKRNNTAHEYNIEKARNLVGIIPEFMEDVIFLLEKWDSL